LLHHDRSNAGETRDKVVLGPLVMSTYTTPLHVHWRRWFRAHRKSLRKAVTLCLSVVATLTSAYLGLLAFQSARTSAKERSFAQTQVAPPPASVSRAIAELTPEVSPERLMVPATGGFTPDREKAAFLRERLVRADALLRNPSLRAAREARMLLEWTLPEVPSNAHARAALAEACMRLHDEACARAAISKALALRPRRSRYRALARQVERAFHPSRR
jgi:hypothetical protein